MTFKNPQTGRCCSGVVEEQTVEVREKPRLLRRLAGHAQRVESLNEPAAVDELTGLRSQRALCQDLDRRTQRCSQSRPLVIVIAEFDHFDELVRDYGKRVADAVLKRGCSVVRRIAPFPRLVFRYGDSGVALLVEAGEREAFGIAERIRATVEVQNGSLPAMTVSCGLAMIDAPVEPWVALDRADAALRDAKRSGCNRVAVSGRTSPNERVQLIEQLEHDAARRAAMALAAATLEVRDSDTADHSEDVVTLCEAVGRRLGFGEEELLHLAAGAQLHDVGKVAIPSTIINKPGPLNEDEWAVIREHTLIGERILRSVPQMAEVATIVRHSHEHWDGSGYPDGLSGDEIPRASRVILCADAFHAMRSDRPYRRGRPSKEALAELKACSGTQFEPAVVDAFVAVAEQAERTNKTGFVGPRNRRLVVLLTTLVIGGGSAVAGIPEVRDAFKSIFGTATGPSFAGATAAEPQEFGFGPLGDLLAMPAAHPDRSKGDARTKTAVAEGQDRSRRGDGRREASLETPGGGTTPGGGELLGGPAPRSPGQPPTETGPAPDADTPTLEPVGNGNGNGNGQALGVGVPTPRSPAQSPSLTQGRTDPPALGLGAERQGKALGHSK